MEHPANEPVKRSRRQRFCVPPFDEPFAPGYNAPDDGSPFIGDPVPGEIGYTEPDSAFLPEHPLDPMITPKKINREDPNEFGAAINGHSARDGYDVTAKRESARTVLLSIEKVGTPQEWLCALEVEAGENLPELARRVSQCPGAELEGEGMVAVGEADFHALARRWDALAEDLGVYLSAPATPEESSTRTL